MNKKYLLLAGTALSAMVSATSAHAADTATVTDTSSNEVEVYTKGGADNTFATKTDVSTALGIIGANYATKGSVTDITKDGGTIDNKISAALSNYVVKDGVKQLSTNDFTNDYKNQLDGLSTTLSNYVEKDGVKQLSTNDFTNAYKNQLDGMSTTLSNYVVKDGVKQLSTNDFTNDYKNQLDGLSTTLSNYVQKDGSKQLSDENFTSAEKTKLAGLHNYDDTALDGRVTAIESNYVKSTDLNGYVQKDGSKVLSTNDFTDAYKNAIDGLGTTYATKTEVDNVDAKFADYTTTAKLQDASTDINAKSLKVNNKDVLTTDSTITHNKVSDWDEAVAAVKVDNATHADKADEATKLTGLTASIAELNVLKGMTASTDELNVLDGLTASTTELNYVDGVTSNIQDQFTDITKNGGTIDTKVSTAIAAAIDASGADTIAFNDGTNTGTAYKTSKVDSLLNDKQDNLVIGVSSCLLMDTDGKT
ncbi:MAG: hypothetical protein IJ852_01020, partial [Alphaproteobacteria bacterium]|nr:hypothetical protein [Alphaproteobacteria bacterium]